MFLIKKILWLKSFWGKKGLSIFQSSECRKFSCLLPWVSDIKTKHPWSIIQASYPCCHTYPTFWSHCELKLAALSCPYGFKPECCSQWDWKLGSGATEMSVPQPACWWPSKVFLWFYNLTCAVLFEIKKQNQSVLLEIRQPQDRKVLPQVT